MVGVAVHYDAVSDVDRVPEEVVSHPQAVTGLVGAVHGGFVIG